MMTFPRSISRPCPRSLLPSDVPSVGMLYQYYHVILSDEGKAWTQEYAYRLYETLKTIPYAIGEGYSKFILTEDKIDDDIKVETSGNSRIVTIGEDAFYYANPFLVNLRWQIKEIIMKSLA